MNQIPNSFHHWLRTFTAIVIFQVIPVSAKNQHSSLNWKYLLPQELNSEISRPQINLNYSDEDTRLVFQMLLNVNIGSFLSLPYRHFFTGKFSKFSKLAK